MSDDLIITRLWGPDAATPAPAAERPVLPHEESGEWFYGKQPALAEPPSSPALHDERGHFASMFKQHENELIDKLDMPQAERRALEDTTLRIALDLLQLDAGDVGPFYREIIHGATVPDERPLGDEGNAVHRARVEQRDQEVRRALRERWGATEAADVLRRTNALIETHEDLRKLVAMADGRPRANLMVMIAEQVKAKRL